MRLSVCRSVQFRSTGEKNKRQKRACTLACRFVSAGRKPAKGCGCSNTTDEVCKQKVQTTVRLYPSLRNLGNIMTQRTLRGPTQRGCASRTAVGVSDCTQGERRASITRQGQTAVSRGKQAAESVFLRKPTKSRGLV
jgi:hypothetical protein